MQSVASKNLTISNKYVNIYFGFLYKAGWTFVVVCEKSVFRQLPSIAALVEYLAYPNIRVHTQMQIF